MRLLIVEDEPKTASYLRQGLREAGYTVEHATDADTGLFLATASAFDVIICDVMLPGANGVECVRNLRAQGVETPVIFLTAKDAVEDRVQGLDAGGDDYLVKPFSFSELLARIRTQLRHGPAPIADRLRAGDLAIDPLRHIVVRSGVSIPLTQKEFALLLLLVRRKGEVLTRTVIAEQVWDMNFESDTNVIDVAIRRLRAKVDDPFAVPLIHTVRGVGYVLRDPS
jgi:two-component system copper resistance phosphate regulon response regulator CusR